MQRTNRQFLGLLKTGTLVLAGIMLVLAGCNGKAEGPGAASKSDPESAVKKPPVKEPPATPKEPPLTPKEPPATLKKPPVTPKEPPVTPKEPPATPKEPPVTPKEPPATPKEPPATPKEPPATPKEPPATPKEPPATPKEPPARPKKPPTARGDIPQPPKPKNDKQKFVLYDVKYIVDAKLKGYAIIARVWARKSELYEKPGVRATFLTFDGPVKGDLSSMTAGNFKLTGGGLSWRTRNPSGRADGRKGDGAWEKQYGVVTVVFKYSFLTPAIVKKATFGFMLRDEDFKPASNILLFDADSFKPGDAKKEFAEVKVQVEALRQTKPTGK